MADTSDIRNGLTITWNGDLWTIIEFLHVKPGKGGAFVRTKLRQVKTGKVVDNTFRSGEKLDIARVERHKFQYLYTDEMGVNLMHTETYEQITLSKSMVAGLEFCKEGESIEVLIHAETEQALTAEIPQHVELLVAQTDPGIKGDTATGATKPATLESGAVINVPLFINEGDVLRVDTDKKAYITRVSQG